MTEFKSIRNDAGKFLLYFYFKKINGENIKISVNDMLEKDFTNKIRLCNALEYCNNKGYIKTNITYGTSNGVQLTNPINGTDIVPFNNWTIFNISDHGIDIVEQNKEIDKKNNFNFAFNFSPSITIDSLMKNGLNF